MSPKWLASRGFIPRPQRALLLICGWLYLSALPCSAAPNPPAFDHSRGFYNGSFSLVLSSAVGTQIRYTRDGSAPSATTGTLYSGPISITTTSVVRAVAYTDSTNVSGTVTHTYIFVNDVVTQPTSIPSNGTKFVGPNWPGGYLQTV